MFAACMAVSDVVKYSAQRIAKPPVNPDDPSPRLEIQTQGESGLRFRIKTGTNHPGAWQQLPGFPVTDLKDATGCGDWCSAGFLHAVGTEGRQAFLRLSGNQIAEGLKFGQALSAVNCHYEGARGPMYALTRREFLAKVDSILDSSILASVSR